MTGPPTLRTFTAATLDELRRDADDFDRAVAVTPGIDRFCSSSAWVLAADAALMGERDPWIWRSGAGWIAMAKADRPGGRYVEPLELAWGLACPIVGPDPATLVDRALAVAAADPDWDALLLAGIAGSGSHAWALRQGLRPGWRLGRGPATARYVASLDGGVDGFLGRRSRNFRKGLRADQRAAAARGMTWEDVAVTADTATAALERVLAVERLSWKGRSGAGIDQGAMRAFYEHMIGPLAARGAARLLVARVDERDAAFILGGVFAGEYRGLQFSYDADLRDLGLGNLGQLAQIERLVAEGVHTYDLGTAMEYKERWAEIVVETALLVVARH